MISGSISEITYQLIIIINAFIALGIGSYYLWRYRKNKSLTTLEWGIGFTAVGIGVILKKIIVDLLQIRGNDYTRLTQTNGVFILLSTLVLSTFSIGLLKRRHEKVGTIITLVLSSTIFIYTSVTSFVSVQFEFNRIITIIYSLWSIVFFFYLGYKANDWRIVFVSVGLLISSIGGFLTVQWENSNLIIIPAIIQLVGYLSIGYGLLYPGQSDEEVE